MTIQEYLHNQIDHGVTKIETLLCVMHLIATKTYQKSDTAKLATEHYNRLDAGCSECDVFETCPLCQINE